MADKKLTRRGFLVASATWVGAVMFTACTQAPPVVSEGGEEAVEVMEEAATEVVEEAPTTIPTQVGTPTPVPTEAAAATFKESPLLQTKVAAGELPPIEERIPPNPLVLKPVNVIGKYGGVINIKNNWLGGLLEEGMYGYSPVRWVDDGQGIAPGLCESWTTNDDNSEWVLNMRKGIKWSDGTPCTMKDTMFWWNDLTIATDPANPDPLPEWAHDATGALVKITMVDDFTLKLEYGTPAPLTLKQLAMWVKGCIGPDRWITPEHYIKQFHPKYNSEYTDFSILLQKITFRQNPECPSLDPWVVVRHDPSKNATWERNPYYYAVDPEGNQLPYIDGWEEEEVTDKEALLAQALQGSIDYSCWMGDLSDYATLKDNEEKGGYEAFLIDSGSGTGILHYYNHDNPDPKRRELYRNKKFRQAMSHALDRATIQEKIYYGTGILTTGTFSPKAYEFNWSEEGRAYYQKARQVYVDYDPEKSKALLDEIDVKDVDGDGWREYPDGSKLEVIIDLSATASSTAVNMLEISKPNFEAVGLKIVINTIPGAEAGLRWHTGQGSIATDWEWADGPDFLVYPDPGTPVTYERWAPLCGEMWRHKGTPQEMEEAEVSPWDRKPPRYNKEDPEYKGTVYEKLHQIYSKAIVEQDTLKRTQLSYDLWNVHIEEGPFFLGSVANFGMPMVVSKKLENVPRREQYKLGGWAYPWILPHMAMSNPETFSFK